MRPIIVKHANLLKFSLFLLIVIVLGACSSDCNIVRPPIRLTEIHPAYTEAARAAKVEGLVVLKLIIDKKGDVSDIQVLRGLADGLTESAVKSAKELHFKPAYRECNNIPVACYFTIAFQYKLSAASGENYDLDHAVVTDYFNELKRQDAKHNP